MEIPLCPYDSCRLLAINLFSYVKNPFTSEAYFDFELFKIHVAYAQRLSDDIVDLEIEKIDKIIRKIQQDPESEEIKKTELTLWYKILSTAQNGRRTGTGVTGEGDMLAALKLCYGTEKATEFSENIHKIMAIAAYNESIKMAKERGAFLMYDYNKDLQSAFIRRLIAESPELGEQMAINGRRNIALLTIAPTGTTSLMTQTTSGIEPVFMPVYKRRRKINPQETNVKVDFVDEMGDSWTEYNVFHHKFKEWWDIYNQEYLSNLNKAGYEVDYREEFLEEVSNERLDEIIKKSPYYKATSNDVDWLAKVKMQGAVQKWVDHSISVTVNLPESAKKELVWDLYIEAWKSGCKGVTVYRDGSRDGVLISKQEVKEVINSKRPKELPCDIHYVQADKKKYYVIVGLLNDKPYELFAFSKKYIQIPQIKKDGLLIKVKSGMYNLKYNGTIIEDITQHFESPEEDSFTRLLSLALKRNISIEDIVNQINKSASFISGFYKAISRVLSKNYIEDGESVGETCPNCGNTIRMIEGCKSCTCGYSACG